MQGYAGRESYPTAAQISSLFSNDDPEIVWKRVTDIVLRMIPAYDFSLVRSVYDDVLRLFRGEYPGYGAIKTLYHDRAHTLDVLSCGVRLMHGVHISGDRLNDDEVTLIIIAILFHDVGYAQLEGEEQGTGAQFTQTHVRRGIDLMKKYFTQHRLSEHMMEAVSHLVQGTEHSRPFGLIGFNDDRERMLGRIVATADITGQMADRIYLEKLLFLYLEFREAHFGSYQSMYDLLCQTNHFYETIREKLDGSLGGIYQKLEWHFRQTLGVDNNYYLESIEKNMEYLEKIVANDEAQLFSMLKRNGVAEKSRVLAQSI